MRLHVLVPIFALAIGALGCGSESTGTPGNVNQAAAKTMAQAGVQATLTAAKSGNGQAAASQFMSAAMSAQGVVTPSVTALMSGQRRESSLASGTCECSATSCTFADCGEGGSTMSGTLSWTGGHVLCDLSFSTSQGYTFAMTTKCDITVTDTSIDGTLSSTGEVDIGVSYGGAAAGAFSWSANTTFSAVKYADAQPTAGTVTVDATYEMGGKTYSGSATVTFP